MYAINYLLVVGVGLVSGRSADCRVRTLAVPRAIYRRRLQGRLRIWREWRKGQWSVLVRKHGIKTSKSRMRDTEMFFFLSLFLIVVYLFTS